MHRNYWKKVINMVEERLLRFTAPELYKHMIEIFSNDHIHTYDIHATSAKKDHGLEVTLRFANDFSQVISQTFTAEQVLNPDDNVTVFFTEAAEKCKALLIADYYKMMKL
jgi:hypothetical protein